MKKLLAAVIIAALPFTAMAVQKQQSITSPDGSIRVSVTTGESLQWSVTVDGKTVLSPSEIALNISDGSIYGGNAVLRKAVKTSINATIAAPVYRKSEVSDNYNQLELGFKAFKVIFRAYDDGVAYRFVSLSKKPFEVTAETAEFAFPDNWNAYIPYVCQNDKKEFEKQLHNSFENSYTHQKIAAWDTKHLAFLPLMVEAPDGVKLCISESDLIHYPGMFLYNADCDNSLNGYFPKYPTKKSKGTGDGRSLYVEQTADYIARCEPLCTFPWRLIGICRKDVQMADNDLVFRLATPQDPNEDFSWVKPGKVAWDWWNSWNIYGVDFESGVNNDTYKYYIDFASSNDIEYVIMDEGWSVGFDDLFHIVPEIDLKGLIEYGRSKGVGIILWAGYGPFQKDIEKCCKVYSEMGVKGFKVDFMDACDQPVVEFHHEAARIAAKYHMLLDFHGTYKPTGLHRAWPNVLNYEGIYGLENMKWSKTADQVTYDVTVPYIRFFAGPADYTQGAMRNANKRNWRPVSSEAMSQGTRCHQLAEYVIFSSPLNMLCDSPSNYMREPECTQYIAQVPEIWDETVTIDGKVGEYIALARRKANIWYVGVLNNWDRRDLTLDLSFLPDGQYDVTIYRDGVNAEKAARDYKKVLTTLPTDKTLPVHLASGGGYVAVITAK